MVLRVQGIRYLVFKFKKENSTMTIAHRGTIDFFSIIQPNSVVLHVLLSFNGNELSFESPNNGVLGHFYLVPITSLNLASSY